MSDEMMRRWTEPYLRDKRIRRDVLAYAGAGYDRAQLVRWTEALAGFAGEALVLWSPDNKVMPPEHGRRLAELIPHAQYREVPGAAVLSMLDRPEVVADEMGRFLTGVPATGLPTDRG